MERGLIIDLWTALSVKLPTRNQRLNQACSFLSAEAGITDLVSSCGSPPGFGTCVCFGWKQSRLLKDTQEVSFRRVGAHPLFFPCQAVFVRAVTECLFLWPVCQSINKTHHEKGNRMQPAVTHLGNAIFMLIHDSAVGMTYEWWVILLRIVQFGLNRKRVSSSCIKSRRLEHICGALMSRRSERSCFMHIRKPRRCITLGLLRSVAEKAPFLTRRGDWEQMCCSAGERGVSLEPPHCEDQGGKAKHCGESSQ